MEITRCGWGTGDPLYERYHDEEWGTSRSRRRQLFEFLILEGAQAGLSWITILRKRENYRAAFDSFDPAKVAQYDDAKIAATAGKSRHRPQQAQGQRGDHQRLPLPRNSARVWQL